MELLGGEVNRRRQDGIAAGRQWIDGPSRRAEIGRELLAGRGLIEPRRRQIEVGTHGICRFACSAKLCDNCPIMLIVWTLNKPSAPMGH